MEGKLAASIINVIHWASEINLLLLTLPGMTILISISERHAAPSIIQASTLRVGINYSLDENHLAIHSQPASPLVNFAQLFSLRLQRITCGS